MKQGAKRLAFALSSLLLGEDRLRNFLFASRLRKLFVDHRINTVIDVGANCGQYRDFLRYGVGFTGRIESFEPIPELAELLRTKAVSDGNWAVHTVALGAEPGFQAINVMASTSFSSFRRPLHVGSHQDHMNTVARTQMVPVSTLDIEFADMPDLTRTYLKLDTQGFDLEVVRGGRKCLAELPALQAELSICPLYEEMPTYVDSIKELESHGFAILDFYLVAADDAKRAIEFDCVMIRSPNK